MSEYTTNTTIDVPVGEGEQAQVQKQQVEVYADEKGNPLKFKVDTNGMPVFDEKGKAIQDPNGQVIPVMDKKNIEAKKKDITKAKKSDGSAVVAGTIGEYKKSNSWWKRALNAGSNMAQGVWELGKSLIGFDKDGKWNWKKGLKNAAILAAGIGVSCIPGVGQVVGPALLYAGLGASIVQVGKGVYNVMTLPDDASITKLNESWQDIGAGTAMLVASKAGIKSAASSAKTAAAVQAKEAALAAGKTDAVAARYGQIAASKVSAWKPWSMMNKTQYLYGKQHTTCMSNLRAMNPFKDDDKKFNTTQEQTTQFNQHRLQEIDTRLSTPGISAEEQALLNAEKSALETSSRLARNARTKVDYTELNTQSGAASNLSKLKDAKTAIRKGETFDYNGISLTEANLAQVETSIQKMEALVNQYNKLTAAKNAMMNSFYNRLCHRSARKDYLAGAPKAKWYSRECLVGGTKKTVSLGLKGLMWEYELYRKLPSTAQPTANIDRLISKQHYEYCTPYDLFASIDSMCGTSIGHIKNPQLMSTEEVSSKLQAYDQQIASISEQIEAVNKNITELSA